MQLGPVTGTGQVVPVPPGWLVRPVVGVGGHPGERVHLGREGGVEAGPLGIPVVCHYCPRWSNGAYRSSPMQTFGLSWWYRGSRG